MSQQPPTNTVLATSKFENVLDALKDRCSWLLVKELLVSKKIKPGLGWADLTARGEKGDAEGAAISRLLRDFFWEYVVAGKRHIQLYELPKDVWAPISNQLVNAIVPHSVFTASYPFSLLQSALPAAPTDQTLCEIRPLPNGEYQMVFCSSRSFEESLTLERNTSPTVMAAVDQAIPGYNRLVAYKQQWVQAFDVITFRPSLERVEVALDMNSRGMSFNGAELALKLLAATAQVMPAIDPIYKGSIPMDLFPAIGEIYKSRSNSELKIVDTNFRTPSGAMNRGKMPSSDEDIREEEFHKNGVAGVKKEIRVGGLVVAWTFKYPQGSAKTKLWTRILVSASQTPNLYDMEISDAAKDSDVQQACTKIVKYL
jgi:hypothetical protein